MGTQITPNVKIRGASSLSKGKELAALKFQSDNRKRETVYVTSPYSHNDILSSPRYNRNSDKPKPFHLYDLSDIFDAEVSFDGAEWYEIPATDNMPKSNYKIGFNPTTSSFHVMNNLNHIKYIDIDLL